MRIRAVYESSHPSTALRVTVVETTGVSTYKRKMDSRVRGNDTASCVFALRVRCMKVFGVDR